MKKIIMSLALCVISANASEQNIVSAQNSDSAIAQAIKYVSATEKIDPRLLYTIVKIESGFDPLVISMLASADEAKYFEEQSSEAVVVKTSKYGLNANKTVVNFYPASQKIAVELVKILKQQNFSFDVGLAQINSTNFALDEAEDVVNIFGNLRRAANVLKICADAKGELKTAIECYNYGLRERPNLIYFKRFADSYKSDFVNRAGK